MGHSVGQLTQAIQFARMNCIPALTEWTNVLFMDINNTIHGEICLVRDRILYESAYSKYTNECRNLAIPLELLDIVENNLAVINMYANSPKGWKALVLVAAKIFHEQPWYIQLGTTIILSSIAVSSYQSVKLLFSRIQKER